MRVRSALMKPLAGSVVVFALAWLPFLLSVREIKIAPAYRTFEFCQYAEIGRNLAYHGEYRTNLLEPMALAYVDHRYVGEAAERWPVISRYPLPCATVALCMGLLGPTEFAAACSNGLAASILCVLGYLLARNWFGAGWAWIATALMLVNPSVYGYFVLLGTPDIWFAVCMVLQLFAWCRLLESTTASWSRALLFGAASGLAYWSRFNVVVFVAVQLATLVVKRRWRDALIALVVAGIVVAPVMLDNYRNFGTPVVSVYSAWNLLADTGGHAVEPWLYYDVPNLRTEVIGRLPQLAAKMLHAWTHTIPSRLWTLWHFYLIMPLAAAGMFVVDMRQSGGRFLKWSGGFFVLQLFVFSGLRLELEERLSPFHGRYFFWFALPALLLALAMLKRLVAGSPLATGPAQARESELPLDTPTDNPCTVEPSTTKAMSHPTPLRESALSQTTGLTWLLPAVIGIQILCYGHTWSHWIAQNRDPQNEGYNLGRDPIRQAMSQLIPFDRVVASNQPQLLAWYSSLKAISMPANPVELGKINRDSATRIDYLFLSVRFNAIDLDPRWVPLIQGSPGGSTMWESAILVDYEYALPPGGTRPQGYVVLRRRDVPKSAFEREIENR